MSDDATMPARGTTMAPPSLPRRLPAPEEAPSPPSIQAEVPQETGPETLKELLLPAVRQAIRTLPKELPKLGLFLGTVFLLNLVLMQVNPANPPAWVPTFMIPVFQVMIFLTTAHNQIIPKTVFWTVAYKAGKHLLRTARKEGAGVLFMNASRGVQTAVRLLRDEAKDEMNPALLGAGIGLIMATYLAQGATDNSAVVLLLAAAIIYTLGVKSSMLLQLLRLGVQDIMRLFRRPAFVPAQRVQMGLACAAVGALISLLFILVRIPGLGYVAGLLAIIAVFVMPLTLVSRYVGGRGQE